MPFSLGHALIGSCLFTATRKEVEFHNVRIMMLCIAVTIIPDADFIFAWGFGLDGWHRGFTHSILFGTAIGFLPALLGVARGFRDTAALVLSALSHTALDGLTTLKGTGVELLWPFTEYRFRFGLFDYFPFYLNPRVNPWSEIFFQLLKVTAIELIVVGPLLVLLIFIRRRTLGSGV